MAYRDELETRRAHLRRLEDRLAELESEEARIQRLPGDEGGWRARLLGGPKVVERALSLEGPLDGDELQAICLDVYDVDGRIEREGDAVTWSGHPEPRPRSVQVWVEPKGSGWTLRVRDEGSHRVYLGLAGVLGIVPQLLRGDGFTPVLALLFIALFVALFVSLRRAVRRIARRRLVEADRLGARARGASRESPRVRVAVGDEEEQEIEATADAARRVG